MYRTCILFPSSEHNHCQYSLYLATNGGEAELAWVAGYTTTLFACPKVVTHGATWWMETDALCGDNRYDSTSIRRPFDCLSKVTSVTVT